MEPLGIISGTIILHKETILRDVKETTVVTSFGNAYVLHSDNIVYVPRHGRDSRHYLLPHLINHRANCQALKDFGVKEIIGINSTGSLKKHLIPGTIVVPDDFIMLFPIPTAVSGKPIHITPHLNEEVRQNLIAAAKECNVPVVDRGVYWQTHGPRLETKAEIAMMSHYADIVGMTMAGEAVAAQELGLRYASLCSVDNFGHGIGDTELTLEEILENARKNTYTMAKIVERYLERRKR